MIFFFGIYQILNQGGVVTRARKCIWAWIGVRASLSSTKEIISEFSVPKLSAGTNGTLNNKWQVLLSLQQLSLFPCYTCFGFWDLKLTGNPFFFSFFCFNFPTALTRFFFLFFFSHFRNVLLLCLLVFQIFMHPYHLFLLHDAEKTRSGSDLVERNRNRHRHRHSRISESELNVK